MKAVNMENLFEDCLRRISAGANLDGVLADYPYQAAELRPMLEAALNLHQFSAEIQPSQTAQMRSRAQFLTAAAGLASSTPKRGFRFSLFHLRLAASSAILIAIFAAVLLLGTGFASADALPGDVFYPVKIMVEQMRINMVQDPPARLKLEDVYDDRRQEEVARLTQMQRRETVTFSGYLQNTDGRWQIGSVELVFPGGVSDPAKYENAYVEIVGNSDNEVVEVQSIKLRQLEWEGVLQKFDDRTWVISGLNILLTDDSQISGQPYIGATVRVTAVRPTGDRFTALELVVKSMPTKAMTIWVQPSSTPSAESGESQEGEQNQRPTLRPAEASSTPLPEVRPTRTREIEEKNRTATPLPTSTRQKEGENHATRTPTSASKPTRTPTGDQSSVTSTHVSEPTRTPYDD